MVSYSNPEILWDDPQPIEYGTPLSDNQLNAHCSFTYREYYLFYDPPEGTQLPIGNHNLTVDMCYCTKTGNITITASKSVTLRVIPCRSSNFDPSKRSLRRNLFGSSLSPLGPLPRSPTRAQSPRKIRNSSPIHSHSFRVQKLQSPPPPPPLTIHWPDPEAMQEGERLSAKQLRACCSPHASGTYFYSPPTGTRMKAGRHKLMVEFYPEHHLSDHPHQHGTKTYSTPTAQSPLKKVVSVEVLERALSSGNEGGPLLYMCKKDLSRHCKNNRRSYSAGRRITLPSAVRDNYEMVI